MIGAITFVALAGAAYAVRPPNVVFLLIDDLGWAEVGWHRPAGYKEVVSPNLDALVADGVELNNAYAFKLCSPTRSAIQSGRNPIHVNAQNIAMNALDPANPLVGVSGIPVNMTGMATRLGEAGYQKRVYSGKADFGMAWQEQTPEGRGYTHTAYYYQHMIDYWSFNVGRCTMFQGDASWPRDLTGTRPDGTTGPLTQFLNPRHCDVQNMTDPELPVAPFPKDMADCTYAEDIFTNHTVDQIMAHHPAEDGPLFVFHAAHSIHSPLEVVPDAFDKFSFIDWEDRQAYHAMVYNVDRAVGKIVDALKFKGMYNDTLIIMTSDNGGPIYKRGTGGGNNYPLRGGKAGNWQGGIRVSSFLSGGAVPEAMRGKKLDGLITAWDWYATLVEGVAGLDPTDKQAATAGLPPIDSVNQIDYVLGRTSTPPRVELPIGTTNNPKDIWCTQNDIVVHGLIQQDPSDSTKLWKLLIGEVPQDIWTGPEFPNATTKTLPPAETVFGDCGFNPGCLFELSSDPTEHHNVAEANPEVIARLANRIQFHNATVFHPKRPLNNDLACRAAHTEYYDNATDKTFWGPFAHLA